MNNNNNNLRQNHIDRKNVTGRHPAITKEDAVRIEQLRLKQKKRSQQTKQTVDRIMGVVIIALLCVALVIAGVFIFISCDSNSVKKAPKDSVKIVLGDSEPVFLKDDDFFYRNGNYYISLTAITDFTEQNEDFNDMLVHGSFENMTFKVNGEECVFSSDSNEVTVNGNTVLIDCPVIFEKEKLFVPATFYERFMENVKCEINKAGGKKGYCISFPDSCSFKIKENRSIQQISDAELSVIENEASQQQKPMFISNLDEYEMYMNPQDKDEYLILINNSHPLDSTYAPSDLTDIADTRKDGRAKQKMRLYAAKSLEALFIEMRANGFTDVSVTSGYRSYDYQSQLFENEVALHGGDRDSAATAVAIPGTSEHQSGLCIDMHNLPSASTAFANEEAYNWLLSNCANFGFILRFPKNKTDITGIMFEPWHYRYVGRYHAQKIMSSGLCLEEYMETLY